MSNPLILISTSLFLAILFLQSGLDKVFDWCGNLEFHTEHFAKSPLRFFTKPMLFILTVLEVACGLISLAGTFFIIFDSDPTYAFYGSVLATIDFLMLFFGQRVAKDYKGAATVVSYFIVALVALIAGAEAMALHSMH